MRIPIMAALGALAAVIVLSFVSCGGGITIAKQGKSPYAIVLSSAASPSEKHAAGELQRFVKLATEAELPLVDESDPRAGQAPRIFVGRTKAFDDLKIDAGDALTANEAFLIRSVKTGGGHDIHIVGNPLRGTMYGVYTFLDRLGFCWYTRTITRFPEGKTLRTEPLDVREAPGFMSRDTTIKEAHDPDWAARNRMNAGHADLDEARGGRVLVNGVHTLDMLVPPELFATHPEYFPLIGGKRVTGLVQRCMSNPEIVEIAAKNLAAWMDREPEHRIFSVSANDVGMLCECPECTRITEEEGSTAGLFLRFVNQVAERVEKTHPDHIISTLAYAITEKAPKITKPRKNVSIRLCPFSICVGHSFSECTYKPSVEFYQTLRDWGKLSDNIFIWHYATDFDAYLMPFANFSEFTKDMKIYKENGVNGMFFQGAGDTGSSDGDLRIWVAARLMWNPDLDANALVNEWMHGVYGQAYAPMRKIYDRIQARTAAPDKHLSIHERIRKEDWPDEELSALDALYTEAEKLAEGDEDALFAVRKNRMSVRYLELLFNSGRLVLDGDMYRPEGNTITLAEYDQYRRDMVTLGIEHLREEPFDCIYEDLLGEKLREHQTATLENDDLKLVVVPDLGGRIVSIVLKATGEEILGKADSLNYFYPAWGGYEESTTMTWGRTGFSNKYTAEVSGRTMTLTAPEGLNEYSRGIVFKRTVTLPPKGMRIEFESTITNVAKNMKYARLISRLELAADPASATVWRRAADGKTVPEASGNIYLNTDKKPDGAWGVETAGWTVENRFPARDIEACQISRDERTGTVAMETLGFEKNLAPGEKIVRKHTYEIRKK